MNVQYKEHVAVRRLEGVPPLPLTAGQVRELCRILTTGSLENPEYYLELLVNRVPAGVDAAAEVKSAFLAGIVRNEVECMLITPEYAIELLGTMVGGYNVDYLLEFLAGERYAALAAEALKGITLMYDKFAVVRKLLEGGSEEAYSLLQSWAAAEWFTSRPALPPILERMVYKISGEVNNDDLSPPKYAATRADIPLHALTLGEDRFPEAILRLQNYRESGVSAAFVGDSVGVGSSRKSAVNSLIWALGEDIPYVPNKRRGGVVIAGSIAPVFFNTLEDCGALPIVCDVAAVQDGMKIIIDINTSEIRGEGGEVLTKFTLNPPTLPDTYRAGGRIPLLIGKSVTQKAREVLGLGEEDIFIKAQRVRGASVQGFTLAQKIIGKACNCAAVLPTEVCEPKIGAVASQDVTGLMTRDELTELACLKFQAPLTIQSFCHTAAYPTSKDLETHEILTDFFVQRDGVALRPGDGIIHSWFNRLLLPDQVGIGGDSHAHSPLGLSFPAGSGLVAYAAALGSMPLKMPESLLVSLEGELREGMVLRDVVNYISLKGSELAAGRESLFSGKILEFEGVTSELTVEQAFELTASAAERSAAGCTVELSETKVKEYLQSNVVLLRRMLESGYQQDAVLRGRLVEIEAWLASPELLRRDITAEYARKLRIELDRIVEPVIAAPNNPNNTCWLSEQQAVEIDEVFVGSCLTNIGHFRAVNEILQGGKIGVKELWIVPPTRMDFEQLQEEGVIDSLRAAGARVEIPGCSACMGNQARVQDNARVFSTSTKNTSNRMGTGAKMYLGSAELAGVVALLGQIPTPEEYLEIFSRKITPNSERIYKYLDFSELYD